jgi:micrococcal nuclease
MTSMKFWFLIILISFPSIAFTQLKGKVVSIADGDTFTLLIEDNEQIKVRLHGIDCPEKAQDFGQVAKKFLSDMIYDKNVTVREMDTDRYGRTIGMVHIGDINVNESLLKAGLAWHYKQYDKNDVWAQMEYEAREAKRGLWASEAMAPWNYRRVKR